jgi:hypothetical protein
MFRTHGINPPYSKMTENRSGNAERDPAPAHVEPEESSRFPRIQVCDSRPASLPVLSPNRRHTVARTEGGTGTSWKA